MFAISEKLHFSCNTIHLSIAFLDSLLSQEPIPSYQHQLYSLTCILIAAKAIELDEKIPFITKILNISSNLFKADEIRRIEHNILAFFEWNLQIPTIIDILEYYLSQGVVFSTDNGEISKGFTEGNEPLKEKNSNDLKENKGKICDFSENFLMKIVEKEMNNLAVEDENKELKEENREFIVKEIENMVYRLSNHILRGILVSF